MNRRGCSVKKSLADWRKTTKRQKLRETPTMKDPGPLLGKTEAEIMRHTGHATEHMVRRYIRVAELQKFNATKGMGL